MTRLPCFKAYDIRGRVPAELNHDLARRIGMAYGVFFRPRQVVIGHDIRESSPGLADALAAGLMAVGVDVFDLGMCGTEEVYFATFHHGLDGGIMVTASHNPAEYNGMKLVGSNAAPISSASGLADLERLATAGQFATAGRPGCCQPLTGRPDYIAHLLGYVKGSNLAPLKLVVNSGNGCAGPVVDLLEQKLPFAFVKLQHTPDGSFPNGVPNPLLPENRAATARAVAAEGADLGIAWDGDFDRCFLFDETGGFVEGYYLVGLLAQALLEKTPGSRIIHDPRLLWNTRELVAQAGGEPLLCRTGHAFIKEKMRAADALYGGEMSGHHYFRTFGYCDSGMIPWLLVCEIMSRTGRRLSELVAERQLAYPVSGEINSRVAAPARVLERIEAFYGNRAGGDKDFTDGLSMSFADFRFNVRSSNTEPVLRLNVETRGDPQLLAEKTAELLRLIQS